MKTPIFKNLAGNICVIVAISCFLLFSSLNKDNPSPAASQCCSGYSVPMKKLRQFMLDSSHGIQFEGGVYAKADLIAAINASPGDSVYLMNVLKNCSISQGTDLAITSLAATGVSFVKAKCRPCPNPNKPCCPQKVCVARIDRSCINYLSFPTAGITETVDVRSLSSE
ncbi:MAG: hypothetical protein ABI861_07690 [Panacibacter sp.]